MSNAFQLKPWTKVVMPHEDIRNDDLEMATYALELGAVARNDPGVPAVYRDARKFFQATHVTNELERLFREVLGLLCGDSYSGDRIIQLLTPFGGGKSHTLAALLHLTRDRDKLADMPEFSNLPNPGPVRTAVFAATETDVESGVRFADGFVAKTIWGSLAYQLGGLAAYEQIRANDENFVAPAGATFARLIGDEPTLILLDELAIYLETAGGKAVNDSTLGRQTQAFLFNLTSVMGSLKRAAMLYSLQASKKQALGNELLLEQLDNLVKRTEAKREPVSDYEVLKIVQRRLFENLGDTNIHRDVASAYGEAYRKALNNYSYADQGRDVEYEVKNLEKTILSSYPFHPDLVKLMYERWGTLPDYQRTRGALQFLATAVAAYWHNRSDRVALPLLGPGDVPFSDEKTRNTFISQVSAKPAIASVFQTDIIGSESKAKLVDRRLAVDYPQLKDYALGSRLSSAILLYSFAGQNAPEKRGVAEAELVAANVSPDFDRGIVKLTIDEINSRALYLHFTDRRFYFDTRENVNKRISDIISTGLEPQEVPNRLERELRELIGDDANSIVWPTDSSRIPDKVPRFRLVYLRPEFSEYDGERLQEQLFVLLENYNVNAKDRKYRNTLGFLRPQAKNYTEAASAGGVLLAIEKILEARKRYNLSEEDIEELNARKNKALTEVKTNLANLYDECWLPMPVLQEADKAFIRPIVFEQVRLAPVVGKPLSNQVMLGISQYVYATLVSSKLASLAQLGDAQAEIDEKVRYVRLAELTPQFFSVPAFPKLTSDEVIKKAVATGVQAGEFGYLADGRSKSDGSLAVSSPKAVKYKNPLAYTEVDLQSGVIIERSYAEELATPATPPPSGTTQQPLAGSAASGNNGFNYTETTSASVEPIPTVNEPTLPLEVPNSAPTPRANGTGKKLKLSFKVDKSKFASIVQLINNVNRLSQKVTVEITVEAEATGEFSRQSLHGNLLDPLAELGIEPDLKIGD